MPMSSQKDGSEIEVIKPDPAQLKAFFDSVPEHVGRRVYDELISACSGQRVLSGIGWPVPDNAQPEGHPGDEAPSRSGE